MLLRSGSHVESTSDAMYALGRAQHLVMQGDLAGAIQVYKSLLESRPADMRMQERFAALLRENGQLDAARILYRLIARHWEETGFYLRAVTSYRILVELEPSDLNAMRHLADRYGELHLTDRAGEIYRRLADTFAVQKNHRRRLAMLARVVEFVPEDMETRLIYASELDEFGEREAANRELASILAELYRMQEWKRYVQVAWRYLVRVPDDAVRRGTLENLEAMFRESSGLPRVSGARVSPIPRSALTEALDASRGGSGVRPLPSSRAGGLETILDRPVPASLFASWREAERSEDRSEEALLVDLASMDAERSSLAAISPPLPARGELGPFSARPFGPTSEVLLREPGHVVAAALRARKRGDAVMALALLEDEGAAAHPVAATFEKGAALAARQQWAEAVATLCTIVDADIAPTDRALVAYYLGVVSEMTSDAVFARGCFERVLALAPGGAPDVPGRIARL